MFRTIVLGASGRMGRAVIAAAAGHPSLAISAAVDRADSGFIGHDSGELAAIGRNGIPVTSNLAAALADGDVVIDFSDASVTAMHLDACAAAGVAALICTTGLAESVEAHVERAAQKVPVLVSANTSLGVTLLIELVRLAAEALPEDFDIEIIEAHHRHKKDAPSGTALALGRAAAAGRQQQLNDVARYARVGVAPRVAGEIGFATVRGGDIVGDHSVLYAGSAERLTLSHQATARAVFARGAIQAAAWLAGQAAGRYQMRDVILNKTKT